MWKRLLSSLAGWLLRRAVQLDPAVAPLDHIPEDPFWQTVRQLTAWAETLPSAPGEVKLQQVVARLLLRYPDKPLQFLHWAVERVLLDDRREAD